MRHVSAVTAMTVADWMQTSGVAFGTSGVRGLVLDMTDEVCFAYTVGYLQYLSGIGEFSVGAPVALGGDLRPDTPRILRACIAAIRHVGGEPIYCGLVPTPALCLYAFERNMPSLMVTGSHIPADRNGIKFNRAHGELLKADELGIRDQRVFLPEGLFDASGAITVPVTYPPVTDVIPAYVSRYRNFFGAKALEGLTLGIYQHSAVARDVLVQIVRELGGNPVPLGRRDEFIPVDTEAVRPEDVELAQEWAAQGDLYAILTADGDSDRPLLADHTGHWLRGDVLGILAARYLGAASVTTPVSSNTALEMAAFAQEVRRTRIGSPFVVAAMTAACEAGVVPAVGYEANGGFLLASVLGTEGRSLSALPTRDAVLPMLCALVAARAHEGGLAALVETLPSRFTLSDRLKDVPTAHSQAYIETLVRNPAEGARELGIVNASDALSRVDVTDGLRMTFESGEIVHLRPSGNAPELRVYVEAASPERAQALLERSIHSVRERLSL